MQLTARISVLAAIAALSTFAFACGGGGLEKVDAEDWVEEVCDKAFDFEDDFLEAGEGLDVLEDGDPDEIKEGVEEFTDATSEAIDQFVKDVEEVGEPDIDGGSAVIKAFRDHAKEQKEIINDFKEDVDKVDDDDDEDFRDDVFELLDDVEDIDLRDRLEDIDEGDVDDLIDQIDDVPGCGIIVFSS